MSVPMIPPPATAAFLVDAGWGGADVRPLAGDASFRRYFRVLLGDRRAVLMDAPPPQEDPRPFIAMADYLNGTGLRAPRILHSDLIEGLVLLEDFGDVRMRETVDADLALETEIYAGVVDVLAALHDHEPLSTIARQTSDIFLDEVGLFLEWYCPAVGLEVDSESYRRAWAEVLTPVMSKLSRPVTVLRDFHAENIMLIDGGQGLGRFGLLDFQDALAGHPAYDLVSLLEDARRDVTPAVEQAMLARYMAARNCGDDFEAAYWVLGAQRNCRILGVFARLWKRDKKPRYLQFQPRMWGLMERDLAFPALAPVREWFDANVAPNKRASFWSDFHP